MNTLSSRILDGGGSGACPFLIKLSPPDKKGESMAHHHGWMSAARGMMMGRRTGAPRLSLSGGRAACTARRRAFSRVLGTRVKSDLLLLLLLDQLCVSLPAQRAAEAPTRGSGGLRPARGGGVAQPSGRITREPCIVTRTSASAPSGAARRRRRIS